MEPPRVPDVDAPNAARMYDYFLGGSANFAVDREAAEQALAITPEIGKFSRANRAFLFRVVRMLCERGVDQFLDLGSGIPTVGNVHEIVHRQNPGAKVAYVDREPIAVAHAEALLRDHKQVTVTQADIRYPREVVGAPGVAEFLDFTRPVAVLAVAILHFIADEDDPAELMTAYRDACSAGSCLVVSHASPRSMTPDEVRRGEQLYRTTSTPLISRSYEQIVGLLPGYQLLDPGVVPIGEWRPDAAAGVDHRTNGYAGVGFLP